MIYGIYSDIHGNLEALQARNAELEQKLSLAQGTISSQGEQLHAETVAKKVAALQAKGLPAEVCKRAQSIMLADNRTDSDEDKLQPSVEGESRAFSPTELTEWLLDAIPVASNGDVASLVLDLTGQSVEKRTEEEKSAKDKADSITAELHPDEAEAN